MSLGIVQIENFLEKIINIKSLRWLYKCGLIVLFCHSNVCTCERSLIQFIFLHGNFWLIKSEIFVWSFEHYLRCWAIHLSKWFRPERLLRLLNF
jgi:hypothetical protein